MRIHDVDGLDMELCHAYDLGHEVVVDQVIILLLLDQRHELLWRLWKIDV